ALPICDLRQRAGAYRDDRVAPYQPAERGACSAASGEQVSPRAGRDQSVWPRGDPFDRASEQGLGDPRHRHRSRRAPALSLRQAGPHAGAGGTVATGIARRSRPAAAGAAHPRCRSRNTREEAIIHRTFWSIIAVALACSTATAADIRRVVTGLDANNKAIALFD